MRVHPRLTLAAAVATAREAGAHPRLGALLAALMVKQCRLCRPGFAAPRR